MKHKICAPRITLNADPQSWFKYWFLFSAYATLFFSCSIVWNQSSHWHWWLLWAAPCPALQDINCQLTAWKIRCPFYPYSVLPRQGTYWEASVSASSIVLHLKSVIWHSSATRLCDSQRGIKTLDDEYFGSSPFCLTVYICCDHVWNQSYWSKDHHSLQFSWFRFSWSCLWIGWVSKR